MSLLSGFGEMDLDGLEDEEPPSTRRTPGSATLVIEDQMLALFTSAEWTLVGSVRDRSGEIVVQTSTTASQAHTQPFIKRWARQLIRSNSDRLRRMGVDVDSVYVQWGGILDDLK
jgi:hypothetical protein